MIEERTLNENVAMNSSRWAQFRATKTYDFLAAFPLIFFYGFALHSQLPLLVYRFKELYSGSIPLRGFLQLTALSGSAIFLLVLIYFLIARVTPLLRSQGFLPRIIAVTGTFLGSAVLFLPVAQLSLGLQAISNILIFGGSVLAIVVVMHLGKAFAIMPEARNLVTTGPYAIVRHPLYVVEALILLGTTLQFQQPWAMSIWLSVLLLQYCRSIYEERVLQSEFPQYAAYRLRTWRFIPGVF
jgi:protein-S-isoprenylcysteine O-methyltransferase Ste14